VRPDAGTRPPTVQDLDQPSTVLLAGRGGEPRVVGGKAASLDRLIGWGLPVPATGVVTTAVYHRLAAQPRVARLVDHVRAGVAVAAEDVDEVFETATLGNEDRAAIAAVAHRVGQGDRVAVRSSATVEDLDRSASAGQYRSLLDIDPTDQQALERSVKNVFASLWHPAPYAYRHAFGIDHGAAEMAAMIMRMVPARRAGVVFTVDPAGAADTARIESVEGLAERLVSGAETPQAVLLTRAGPRSDVEPVTAEALDLALDIEARAGTAQDVEWAWDGRRVWAVQARPITVTAAGAGDGFDDDPRLLDELDLTTLGIGEMLPGVLPPLVWGLAAHLVEDAFRRLLDDLGALPDDLIEATGLVHRVRGRAAMDFGALEQMASSLPGSAAEELEQEYFGSRRRGRAAAPARSVGHPRLRSAAHDLRVLRARHTAVTEAAATVAGIDGVLAEACDPARLDRRALVAYHARLIDLAARTMAAELGVAADAAATHRRLQVLLTPHLGEVEAGREADRMVAQVGVAATTPATASAAVFAGPTWHELGRDPPSPRRKPGGEERERSAIDDLLDHLKGTPGWREDSIRTALRRRAIRRLAHETAHRLDLRERAKASLLTLGGAVRRVHLEAGSRLTEAGDLDRAEDVDLLSPAELRDALTGGPVVAPALLAHRRRWLDRYRQDGALPARFSGWTSPVAPAEVAADCLEGWAASAGRFRGSVEVVDTATADLTRDAVLVAEATDPSWSPLFMKAGAIVLDRGGPLSHAAILARELGVPAVLNVPGATRLLAGREVTVDGDAGIVIVHDTGDQEAPP
jgi:pyruvate,water dikinase